MHVEHKLTSSTGKTWSYRLHGGRLRDYAPHVLEALKNGPLNQGDLQEAVWGTSGRGNASLIVLFNSMVMFDLIKLEKRGRANIYSIAK